MESKKKKKQRRDNREESGGCHGRGQVMDEKEVKGVKRYNLPVIILNVRLYMLILWLTSIKLHLT